jgi:initiation factor 1A
MVKNTSGGSKHKSFARKRENTPQNTRLRLSTCNEEQYACVTKMNGNNCSLTTANGVDLVGHIRGKMTGRNRRSCNISKGTIVLIGLRDWEKTPKNCDILEVYGPNEVEQLKMIPNVGFERLRPIIDSTNLISSDVKNNDDIEFTTNEYLPDCIDTIKEETSFIDEDDEQIDFDDI